MDSHIFLGFIETKRKDHFTNLFMVLPYDLCNRIIRAFIPPIRSNDKVYVDLLGPIFAVLFLIGFVTYGNSFKLVKISFTPTEFIFLYSIIMPVFCFFVSKLGRSDITIFETLSVVGYSLYGHIFTLLASFIFFEEKSNFFFFICLIIFGGLSTFRLIIIFLRSIEIPGARLLICATIAVLNILSVIFLHFAYMHRSYVYVEH